MDTSDSRPTAATHSDLQKLAVLVRAITAINEYQAQFLERRSRMNRDEPQDDSAEPMHRGSGSEVDDFSPGPRQPHSDCGGFESDRGTTNPGGAKGEHSGEKIGAEGNED